MSPLIWIVISLLFVLFLLLIVLVEINKRPEPTCPNCGGSHTRMYEDVFNEDVPEAEKLEGIGPIYKITACKSCETILIMVPTGRWRGESKNERTCEFAS